ncbi:hypothetical protein C8R46DRAFT_447012 [Mycena filopes]|nr:hypothetical protein C8R46DRAFT_447012 [Mycena filopes]
MHHNPSRMVRERRQSPAGASPSATAVVDSDPAPGVNLTVPTSTTALAVVVSILCLAILIVSICLFRRRRNAKKSLAPSNIVVDLAHEKASAYEVDSKLDLASAYGLEKPGAVFIPGASAADANPNWVPQINLNRDADLASSSTSSSKKSKKSKKSLRASRGWDRTFSKFAPSERSPPPSYMVANGGKTNSVASQIPLPPSPPHHSEIPPTPPTPPAKKSVKAPNPFSREIPPAKPVPSELPPSMPLPSPARSASFAAHQSASFSQMDKVDEENMPRLMNVVETFTPSMEDELLIQIGETVRVLEEYQDGWALVQRIGRFDAPKGVVPRSCIAERERVIPVYTPGRRL